VPTACAVLCVDDRSCATTVHHRRWFAPSPGFGCPTRNGRSSQEQRVLAKEEELGGGRSDAELEESGTGGWRQEVSSTLVGIRDLLREKMGF